MKETLETIIKSLVKFPDKVSVNEKENGKTTVFEVKVDETDMGRVIGKDGKTANAIRTIMKSFAIKEKKFISVEFIG